MVYTDWTITHDELSVGESGTLDATIKYAGNSSLNLKAQRYGACWINAAHSTFSQTSVRVIMWVRTEAYGEVNPIITHSSYGNLSVYDAVDDTWEKFRVSYWYDAVSSTKWGRVEKWNGSTWVQIGTDTNFGSGSPIAGTLNLKAQGQGSAAEVYYSCWFDELEVYI